MQRTGFARKKALYPRPPHPFTAPAPPMSRMIQQHVSDTSSSSALSSDLLAPSSSGSQGSDSGDSGAESSSESESGQESDEEQQKIEMSHAIIDSEQLPDTCLGDRCLQPLHKLQQPSFVPGGKQDADAMAQPSGLVWQNSGFMTPFSPRLVGLRRGDSRQISTAATGVTSVQGRGTSPAACSAVVCYLSCLMSHSSHLQQHSTYQRWYIGVAYGDSDIPMLICEVTECHHCKVAATSVLLADV